MREREAVENELIQVRSFDLAIAEHGDGVGALVVGEEKNNIGSAPEQVAVRGDCGENERERGAEQAKYPRRRRPDLCPSR